MLGIRVDNVQSEDPLFLDPTTKKEVTLTASHKYLVDKRKEAGLSEKMIKGHSLRMAVHLRTPTLVQQARLQQDLWDFGARGAMAL